MQDPTKRQLLSLGTAILAGAMVLSCGGNSGTRTCEDGEDCPHGMFCDTIVTGRCQPLECTEHTDCPIQYLCGDNGECYDPTDGNTTSCFPNHPGCPCTPVDLYLTIDCIPPNEPVGVDASCHVGLSTCDGERYGPCEDTYRDDCDGIIFGPSMMHPDESNSENVIQGVEGEIQLEHRREHRVQDRRGDGPGGGAVRLGHRHGERPRRPHPLSVHRPLHRLPTLPLPHGRGLQRRRLRGQPRL